MSVYYTKRVNIDNIVWFKMKKTCPKMKDKSFLSFIYSSLENLFKIQ